MMRSIFSLVFMMGVVSWAEQLPLPLGDAHSILQKAHFLSPNLRLAADVPEEITKMWDERDFAFEIADGYYSGGPIAQYEVLDEEGNVIGYMLAQTLSYSQDPEYHVAYTVCDVEGHTVIELEYEAYHHSEVGELPPELRPTGEE